MQKQVFTNLNFVYNFIIGIILYYLSFVIDFLQSGHLIFNNYYDFVIRSNNIVM